MAMRYKSKKINERCQTHKTAVALDHTLPINIEV